MGNESQESKGAMGLIPLCEHASPDTVSKPITSSDWPMLNRSKRSAINGKPWRVITHT